MTDVGKPEHLPGPAVSRRRFLGRGATAGAAIAGGTLWVGASAVRGGKASSDSPIRHIVISMQENRSFDHYYGYAPQVQAAGFGRPPATRSRMPPAGPTRRSS